jgi:hypothetical protein
VQTYVILRRSGWRTREELREQEACLSTEAERFPDDIRWIRSYVVEERDQTLGTVCIYEAVSPEAVRRHAAAADLPVDEIVRVADTIVLQPDESTRDPREGGQR